MSGETKKTAIGRQVIFGDSLSDSGNLDMRRILGIFKIPGTGLDKSGDGRFANGLSWPGFFALTWAKRILTDSIAAMKKKYHWTDKHADTVRDTYWKEFVHDLIQPTNKVNILADNIIRNYAEGGATAASYSLGKTLEEGIDKLFDENPEEVLKKIFHDITHPKEFFEMLEADIQAVGAQAIVINLAVERHQFFENEKKSFEHKTKGQIKQLKDETLVTVWAGANDLITVNTTPTMEEAQNAIKAIINHVKELQKNGYNNIQVMNLPDLTKTPRYQNMLKNKKITAKELNKIQGVVKYFNQELAKQFNRLNCNGEVFDVFSHFNEVYNHPQKYGFDPKTLTLPLTDNPNYKPKRGIDPEMELKAMFWNDVHPTSKMQDIIEQLYKLSLDKRFDFSSHQAEIEKIMEQAVGKISKKIELQEKFSQVSRKLDLNFNMTVQVKGDGIIFNTRTMSMSQYLNDLIENNFKEGQKLINGLLNAKNSQEVIKALLPHKYALQIFNGIKLHQIRLEREKRVFSDLTEACGKLGFNLNKAVELPKKQLSFISSSGSITLAGYFKDMVKRDLDEAEKLVQALKSGDEQHIQKVFKKHGHGRHILNVLSVETALERSQQENRRQYK